MLETLKQELKKLQEKIEKEEQKNKEIDCNLLPEIDKYWIGKKVIVRTYSAGIHYGEIELKSNDEIILRNARRLWYWKTLNNGISISEIANDGLDSESKVCQSVSKIYLKAIELIECTDSAIKNIEGQYDYKN